MGGAAEAGETLEAAAYREIEEETGLQVTDLGPVVHQRQAQWVFEGTHYEQSEVYYLVRTEEFTPAGDGLTQLERATHRGHRWWSVDEVRSARERIYPEGLADLLERLAHRLTDESVSASG
ncbi:MAG TPA: NUDIX domain-containing protein [Candidatus Dormibacteraeota bacterium]|nr:NUDIX domain-containing protein [Candidatus Dormibacteraeota bacterium]